MDLLNLPNNSLTELSAGVILVNITIAFLLAMVIVTVYRKTHKGISYSQSFVVAMIMMTILATIAMMILSNNLVRALGVLGIFALIRFRTIIKDTKDIAYLFFVLAMGMAVGTDNYMIAIMGTAILSVIVFLLHKYNFGSTVREGFLLTFIADGAITPDTYKNIFRTSLSSYKLLQIKAQSDGDQEYYYSVRFKKDDVQSGFIGQLKSLPVIKMAELISGRDSTEY